MILTHTEENYLKAIYNITEREGKAAATNAIATAMNTAAASVTDMLKRLARKKLLNYEKSRGVTLSTEGGYIATMLVRRHRLWEVFLVEKLGYNWDEVHDIAEQLEHVDSVGLIDRLAGFLDNPKFDPHGDPIPDAEGNFTLRQQVLLSEMKVGERGIVVGVQEHSPAFLQFLDRQKLGLGAKVQIMDIFEFDGSVRLRFVDNTENTISAKVSKNLFMRSV